MRPDEGGRLVSGGSVSDSLRDASFDCRVVRRRLRNCRRRPRGGGGKLRGGELGAKRRQQRGRSGHRNPRRIDARCRPRVVGRRRRHCTACLTRLAEGARPASSCRSRQFARRTAATVARPRRSSRGERFVRRRERQASQHRGDGALESRRCSHARAHHGRGSSVLESRQRNLASRSEAAASCDVEPRRRAPAIVVGPCLSESGERLWPMLITGCQSCPARLAR